MERFLAPGTDRRYVFLAELGKKLVGFVCVLLDEEPEWGACMITSMYAQCSRAKGSDGPDTFAKATEERSLN